MEIDSRQLSAFSCQLLNTRGQHAFHLGYLLEELLADGFIEVTQVGRKDNMVFEFTRQSEHNS